MRQTAFLAIFLIAAAILPAADPTLVNMVMPDVKVLAGVNVSKAETSPFGQYILRSMPTDKGFEQFINTSGFDPRTDVQEILAASNTAPKTGIVLARGKFNAAMISSAALSSGEFTVTTYNGAQLITPTKGDGETMAIIMDVTPSTIAMVGDLATVKGAIDRRKGSNPLNSVLVTKVAAYSASDAWSVSIAPLSSIGGSGKGSPMGGMVQADLFKKIQATSGGITFSSPIQITGEAVADTPQDASALGDVLKFLGSMLLNSTQDPHGALLGTIAKTLNVTTVQNTVKIALSIPEADLENMMKGSKAPKAGII